MKTAEAISTVSTSAFAKSDQSFFEPEATTASFFDRKPALQRRSFFNDLSLTQTSRNPGGETTCSLQAKCEQCEEEEVEQVMEKTELTIGEPDDPYEKEADEMADQVIRRMELENEPEPEDKPVADEAVQLKSEGLTPEAGVTSVTDPAPGLPILQRCEECEKEEESGEEKMDLQRKPIFDSAADPADNEDDQPDIQRRVLEMEKTDYIIQSSSEKIISRKDADSGTADSSGLGEKLAGEKGRGEFLEPKTRNSMETAMGADFSGVRVHDDQEAHEMSAALHAQAFTHGSDIYFNRGKFDPTTGSGRHLLAHELTHTIQQGAAERRGNSPKVQKQEEQKITSAAKIIMDDLDGYTSRWDSEEILNQFTGKGKSEVEAIINEMKTLAPSYGSSWDKVIEWLFYDMTAEDGIALRNRFIELHIRDVIEVAGDAIDDLLSGYTSESNSGEILQIISGFESGELDELMKWMENKNGYNSEMMVDWLFDDLTSVHGEHLRVHFLARGGVHTIKNYGAYYTASKIYALLSGYTSHADSSSILANFNRSPVGSRSVILYELNNKTGTEWGKRGAADALMQDMDYNDYLKLTKVGGITLPAYDYEAGWLESTWEGFLSEQEWKVVLIEYLVCGIVGVVTGILSVIVDLVVLVKDLVVAVYDLIGAFVYLISGGAAGSEEWLAVKEFFKGLGKMFGHPGDVITTAWNEIVEEGTLIEGPFENCKEAEFWVRKFVNLIVNIILIFAGGYGLVKEGASGIKAIVTILRANGFREGMAKIAAMILKGSITTVTGLSNDVVKILNALKTPAETLGSIRQQLTLIRLAATEEGYWKFVRGQAGKAIEGEKDFWSKYKEGWKSSATAQEERAATIEGKMTGVTDDIEGGRVPQDTDVRIETIDKDTKKLSDDVGGLQEEVTGTKQPLEPKEGAGAGEPKKPVEEGAPAEPPATPEKPVADANTEKPVVNGETLDHTHGISITDQGNLKLCSYPCNFLKEAYSRELVDNPALQRRLNMLENTIKRELQGEANKNRLQELWEEGRQLQADLEAARLRYVGNLQAAREAFPAQSGALTQIESELSAAGRQDLFEMINDVARLQTRDGKISGFEDWIISTGRQHGVETVDITSELIEARRLALQYADDSDVVIKIGQDAKTTGRSFDIQVERSGATGRIERQVEIFREGPVERGTDLVDGVRHGAEKIPEVDDILARRKSMPNEKYESTVIIEWPPAEPVPARDGPDITYSYSGNYVAPSAQNPAYSGNFATDLVRRLNGMTGAVDTRINALTNVNIVDQNGNLIWRLRNNPVGSNWKIEFIVPD